MVRPVSHGPRSRRLEEATRDVGVSSHMEEADALTLGCLCPDNVGDISVIGRDFDVPEELRRRAAIRAGVSYRRTVH